MYVAKIPNHGSSATYLLRESYREGGKVKSRTIGNITSLGIEKIARINQLLKGVDLVPAQSAIHITHSRPHGHVEAVLTAIHQLGLDKFLSPEPSRQRNLVLAMIVQRIIAPRSKLGTTRDWNNTTLADELNIDTEKEDADSLYEAMDWLLQRQRFIEQKLAKRHLSEQSMILYDISSSYVEGGCCPLAQWGYNRDGKSGKKIIVYGLLTDSQGNPISIHAYPGNTNDSKTIPDQVSKIRHQFGLQEVTIVGDRGMLTGVPIEQLQKYPGIRHLSALRSESIRRLLESDHFDRSLLDETHLAEIISDDYPDERLIVCHNPLLEKRRQNKREELLVATEKILSELSQQFLKRTEKGNSLTDTEIGIRLGRVINKYHVAKHFETNIEKGIFSFQRNTKSIQYESELDGFYVIRTNIPAEQRKASELVRDYKRLADVEKSFRTIKTTLLDIRPIHHRLEKRVRAHFFICMLSYYVVCHLRRVWSPYLFSDENLGETRTNRHPVMTAKPNKKIVAKKARNHKIKLETKSNGEEKITVITERVQSFQTILNTLATICKNDCQMANEKDITFNTTTLPTPFQEILLK
ncbi:MAG: IS1634 family transposase [Planctomycetaceae bacterium]|jgi:transposase|nr:IS1634 family transposase [Planctomycetaceae bacterium]